MTNPNVEYKRAWKALRAVLGREPRASDPEYWELTNRLSRSYEAGRWEEGAPGDSEEARSANLRAEPAPGAGTEPRANSGGSRPAQRVYVEPCRSSAAVAGHCAEVLGRPCIGSCVVGASERVQEPRVEARSEARRPVLGSRGPNGGLYALCEECGEMWEREKQRGRPVAKCVECRE